MRPNIRLGRLFGIDIGLHYSWLIIAFLIVFSLAGHFKVTNPEWESFVVWSLAGITAILFFVSILVHELSHALVAKRRGMFVRSITLFALGGVANLESESSDAKSEFWTAIVGPVSSVAIGLVFLGLAGAIGSQPDAGTLSSPIGVGFAWLGYINIALAVFNMIPGYPLDGGRVLRAVVWRFTGSLERATRIAAGVGQFIAAAFIIFGLFRFFAGAGFGGLWLAFIGWFLSQAAAASRAEVEASSILSGVRVRDVMSKNCPTVSGSLDLGTFAEDYLLRSGRRCFIVLENGRESGLITVHELKQTARERWPFTAVSQVALPFDRVRTISPDANVRQALEIMAREDLNQLPVLSNSRLVGIISRPHVLQFIQTQAELKAA
jgi:Zn-dependent protease/predicted transcriptional regulator